MALTRNIAEAGRKRAGRDSDYRAWLLDQAHTIRKLEGKVARLDCAELAEELEGIARSDERALESLLENLLTHLLNWSFQAGRRTRSWRASVDNARSDIHNLLADSPSLKTKVATLLARAYEKARRSAGAEMELEKCDWDKAAPRAYPWDFDLILSDFWPDPINPRP